jgi:hypothetical protein
VISRFTERGDPPHGLAVPRRRARQTTADVRKILEVNRMARAQGAVSHRISRARARCRGAAVTAAGQTCARWHHTARMEIAAG